MQNNETLQKMIELLKKYLNNTENLKEAESLLQQYQDAEKEIEDNLFKLLDHTDLLIDTKIEDNKEYLYLIETLRILKNNSLVTLTDEQKQEIENSKMFKYCVNSLRYFKNKVQMKYNEIKNSSNENDDILKIIKELEQLDDELIEEELLNNIFNKLNNEKVSKTDIELLLYLSVKYNNEIFELLKTKELLENREKLTDQELEEIFKKYGYDYSKVNKEQKQKLRIKGDIKNIEEVFEAIDNYSIPFKETEITSISLLIKSDKNAIETIYQLSQKYNVDFSRIIRLIPGVLIHKSSKAYKNNSAKLGMQQVQGSYEDFEENIKLLEECGYDIKDVMKSTITIFIVSNKTLRKNVEELRKYGFPKNLYEIKFKLSGLKGDAIKNIDRFIELDEFNYIKQNTSRLCLEQTSPIFTRLYFAKKLNKSGQEHYEIKRKTKNKEILTGIVSNEEDTTLNSIIDKNTLETDYPGIDSYKEILEFLSQEERKGYPYEMSNDELMEEFEKLFKQNQIEYKINDITISRYKAQRIYSLLTKKFKETKKDQLLLFALTYNSLLSHDEYEKIKSDIKELSHQKSKEKV